jgi:3-hydroxybutyryl-CoA dehydrogenase
MNEAGLYGRKSGRGYYTYTDNKANERLEDIYETKAERIFDRIFCLLVNEAYDALFMNIASIDDIDIAMTKGVNYPKGLFAWSESYGLQKVLNNLENLFNYFNDDRYRPNPLLRDSVSR